MADVTLNPDNFRAMFPEFPDPPYTDAVLQLRWDNEAILYVTAENCGDLQDAKRSYACMLMLAHLLRLSKVMAEGATGGAPLNGVVTQATIDKVTVSLRPPADASAWGNWIATTPYGQQLAAYLRLQAAGGLYVGGNDPAERSAFRKAGGVW